jgi:hypothetical protein
MNLAKPIRLILALLLVGAAAWYQQWSANGGREGASVPQDDAIAFGLERGWSRSEPEVNLTHIFFGEINRSGKPVGYHSRPGGRDHAGARVARIQAGPNRAGVYTARVEIAAPGGGWREKFSSFFPDRMDQGQVLEAVLHAYRNRNPGQDRPWEGPSGQGFRVQGYVSSRGGINTAFPVYQR